MIETFKAYKNLILVIAFFVLVVGAYFYGRSDGAALEAANTLKRDNKALVEASDKLEKAQARVAALEREDALSKAAASTKYQEDLKNVEDKKNRTIADLRAGLVRLRDPGRQHQSNPGVVPERGPGDSGGDGKAGAELSGETSEFLVSEATRANKIVLQLTACQKELTTTIKTCTPEQSGGANN